jgi:hypothetical protein
MQLLLIGLIGIGSAVAVGLLGPQIIKLAGHIFESSEGDFRGGSVSTYPAGKPSVTYGLTSKLTPKKRSRI